MSSRRGEGRVADPAELVAQERPVETGVVGDQYRAVEAADELGRDGAEGARPAARAWDAMDLVGPTRLPRAGRR